MTALNAKMQIEHNSSQPDQIQYSIRETSLGDVLIGINGEAINLVLLGDSPGQLFEDAQAEFPDVQFQVLNQNNENLVSRVVDFIEHPSSSQELPIKLVGTEFQLQVWEALRRIPPGETRTYGDTAKEIGKPSTSRAVGAACGSNRLALIVPCHRVVPKDGRKLSHYRWGTMRKEALLLRESSLSALI